MPPSEPGIIELIIIQHMKSIILSLLQMKVMTDDPVRNISTAETMIHSAIQEGSQIILLPELWSSGFQLHKAGRFIKMNTEILTKLCKLARRYNIWIGGSLIEESGNAYYNTFYWINRDGIAAKYRKVHLFPLMEENIWLQAGNSFTVSSTPQGCMGFAICYDLRFPEVFRYYALKGVQLCLISAAWPLSRIDHWKILLQARAIENQFFIAATNCVGVTGNETFGGSSMVISPVGEITESSQEHEQIITTQIDLSDIDKVRSVIPLLESRRPKVYEIPSSEYKKDNP